RNRVSACRAKGSPSHLKDGVPRMVHREAGAAGMVTLRLPTGFRPEYALAYHGRDPLSVSERVAGRTIFKTVLVDGSAHRLAIDLAEADHATRPVAHVRMDQDGLPSQRVETIAGRMLGLASDAVAFE